MLKVANIPEVGFTLIEGTSQQVMSQLNTISFSRSEIVGYNRDITLDKMSVLIFTS